MTYETLSIHLHVTDYLKRIRREMACDLRIMIEIALALSFIPHAWHRATILLRTSSTYNPILRRTSTGIRCVITTVKYGYNLKDTAHVESERKRKK